MQTSVCLCLHFELFLFPFSLRFRAGAAHPGERDPPRIRGRGPISSRSGRLADLASPTRTSAGDRGLSQRSAASRPLQASPSMKGHRRDKSSGTKTGKAAAAFVRTWRRWYADRSSHVTAVIPKRLGKFPSAPWHRHTVRNGDAEPTRAKSKPAWLNARHLVV
jgi:hypothetical protein